tara:strand:- start:6874 stop:7344 length:471 start_codon:yes stop_codon:yes gene_type:complete
VLIRLLAVGRRQPDWVTSGFQEYAKRIKGACKLDLIEIAPGQRSKGKSSSKAKTLEGERLLKVVSPEAYTVALTVEGQKWSTVELVSKLGYWETLGSPICMLIGGADGLEDKVLARANEHWSLSSLTLPHGLVRVVVAEALYRAWSVRQKHPYHRI